MTSGLTLTDIRKAIGKAISLSSLEWHRLYKIVKLPLLAFSVKKSSHAFLLLPQLRLLATHPNQTVLTRILHGILARCNMAGRR